MRIKSQIHYGLRAIIEIANHTGSLGILQTDIAAKQNISFKYLDSIINSLKLKGLIANAKGKGSGYKLTRAPENISMLDIYTAFEEITVDECINNKNCSEDHEQLTSKNYWQEFTEDFELILRKKNLLQIIEDQK